MTEHKGIIAWFTQNPVAANLLMVSLIILGLVSMNDIRKEAFPSMEPRFITISMVYDSGDAEQAEEGIAIKIENALEALPGIKRITSTSHANGSTVQVEKETEYDLDVLFTDIKAEVDSIYNFPSDAEKPVIEKARRQQHAIWVQLYGDVDHSTLQYLGEQLERDLLAKPDIRDVNASSFIDPMISVEIDEAKLQAYGLSLSSVSEVINQESNTALTTSLRNKEKVIRLKASEQAYYAKDFADIPLITFSNDTTVARNDVFVMGHVPEQSVERSARFAIAQGARNFAALAPRGDYGNRTLAALERVLAEQNGRLVSVERYDRSNTSILSAADRLTQAGGFDTVVIADGARLSAMAAQRLKNAGDRQPSIIGTELWSGEDALTREATLRGAWFSAVPDNRYRQFAQSYSARFGNQPNHIAMLGYDAVLLTLRLTRDWRPGRVLPQNLLTDSGGFLGLEGPFRFHGNGVGERAFEVRQVGNGAFSIVDPAPQGF